MINNRKLIEPLLVFPKEDSFYFIQILQRKKDHRGIALGGSNNNSRLIKAYFITSLDKLDVQWGEIVKLAEVFEARVMINLNPRSFKKAAFHLLQKVAGQMANGDFHLVHKAYTAVCGEYHSEMDKRWIIDIDNEDLDKLDEIERTINNLHSFIDNKNYKILAKIPSKSGYHIISNPFNLDTFTHYYPNIEIHKNNPTNLYIA